MPSTSVNLKRVKRDKGFVYQIDYRINGKRIREIVGRDKRTVTMALYGITTERLGNDS